MKPIALSIIFLMSFLLTTNPVFSGQLSPFGDFKWSDNAIDVFQKLKKIDSLEKITIKFDGTDHFRNTNFLKKSKSDFVAGIQDGIKKRLKDSMFKYRVEELVLKNGDTSLLYHEIGNFEISAHPVVLSGIPFKMSFSFKNVPGYTLTNPDKAIIANVSGKKIYFLAQFESIEFLSTNKELGLKNQENLLKIMNKKYGVMKDKYSSECIKLKNYNYYCATTNGDFSIGFRSRNPYQVGIIYKNSFKSVEKSYKDHQTNKLSDTLKGNDSSSAL